MQIICKQISVSLKILNLHNPTYIKTLSQLYKFENLLIIGLKIYV